MEKTKTIYEVLHDSAVEGPAGDGTIIARFSSKLAAETFASWKTCYGRPATVEPREVTRKLAARWGL